MTVIPFGYDPWGDQPLDGVQFGDPPLGPGQGVPGAENLPGTADLGYGRTTVNRPNSRTTFDLQPGAGGRGGLPWGLLGWPALGMGAGIGANWIYSQLDKGDPYGPGGHGTGPSDVMSPAENYRRQQYVGAPPSIPMGMPGRGAGHYGAAGYAMPPYDPTVPSVVQSPARSTPVTTPLSHGGIGSDYVASRTPRTPAATTTKAPAARHVPGPLADPSAVGSYRPMTGSAQSMGTYFPGGLGPRDPRNWASMLPGRYG